MPKYRGWCELNNKFIFGSLICAEEKCFIFQDGRTFLTSTGFYTGHEVIKESVGQFVTTQNGIDIFENDIVKGNWNIIGFIYFDTDFLQFRIKLMNKQSRELDFFGKLEVIGNLFENPELMEAKK